MLWYFFYFKVARQRRCRESHNHCKMFCRRPERSRPVRLSGGSTGSSSEAKKEGKVLAEVNGATITTGDFSRELKNLPEYLKAMADTPRAEKRCWTRW